MKSRETARGGAEKKTAGDYEITYHVEAAKGLYEFSAGKLEWEEPRDENVHLDVLVSDAADGRFVPGLHIVATLLDSRGGRAASMHLPFVWHPEQSHYGANVKVPESGEYLLQLHIFPATFHRADEERGRRFAADAHVSFENVRIDLKRRDAG